MKFNRHFWMAAIIAMGIGFIFPAFVLEASPLFPGQGRDGMEQAAEVPSIDQSYAFYGKLVDQTQSDFYKIKGTVGQILNLRLLIPQNDNENFDPQVVIIGPGLSKIGIKNLGFLEIQDNQGVFVVEKLLREKEIMESSTQTVYHLKRACQLPLPETAEYYIMIYSDKGEMGGYVLALGPEADLSINMNAQGVVDFLKVRAWYQPPQVIIPMALIMLALLVILFGRKGTIKK